MPLQSNGLEYTQVQRSPVTANCSVCESDVSGATALSSTAASSDLYGTQAIGSYGKVRSLKAVAVFKCWRSRWDQTHFGRFCR
uniref:Uncharacterized protein n=1 Tax=Zea mays TaxID=4577 RepID=A0A804MN89_MAIZE